MGGDERGYYIGLKIFRCAKFCDSKKEESPPPGTSCSCCPSDLNITWAVAAKANGGTVMLLGDFEITRAVAVKAHVLLWPGQGMLCPSDFFCFSKCETSHKEKNPD